MKSFQFYVGSALALFCVTLSGCRDEDFLHHWIPTQAVKAGLSQKVKEVVGNPKVDIVWIVDNSGSMGSHQENVIKNADFFIKEFIKTTGLQWTLSVISTSIEDKPYLGMGSGMNLDWTTPNPVSVFQTAIQRLGTGGDPTEMIFSPFMQAVTRAPTYLREDSVLALMMVTDAPEQSNVPASDFLAFLSNVKKDLSRVVTYGILGPQDWGCRATDSNWDYAGSPNEELIKATHGKTYKLCDSDFGKYLADMGKDLLTRVSNPRIYLDQRPKSGTLRVYRGDELIPGGPASMGGKWIYDFELNVILFNDLSFAPTESEEVRVEYEVDDGY